MRTTKEDFQLFQDECQRWIDYFGLYDWAIWYEWEKLDDAQAEYYIRIDGRLATIRLHKGNVSHPIPLIAKHEIVEALLIGRLKEMAKNGKSSDSEIEEEVHRIVRIIENRVVDHGN